ncbi:hypothetical protein D3H55_17235 [Bacillus salacetis]|uniref:WYL domain-containing protein n=1 Tax=Bacillus salacetis TaxID=2315464 RepID=A0A3A1QX22_9BACI|nr:hypothetical protein [Bacillus salacetis]RIW30188.1 hypothetical protein D3H55_17235 [Bacillus salacetis]
MEKILKRAFADNTQVEIIYRTEENVFTQRSILIMKIEKDHIRAFCCMRKQFRTFRTENILAAFPKGCFRKNPSTWNVPRYGKIDL